MSVNLDPLLEILNPAADLARKIVSGARSSKNSERLLAGALEVLLAERDAMLALYQGKVARELEMETLIGVVREHIGADVFREIAKENSAARSEDRDDRLVAALSLREMRSDVRWVAEDPAYIPGRGGPEMTRQEFIDLLTEAQVVGAIRRDGRGVWRKKFEEQPMRTVKELRAMTHLRQGGAELSS